MPQPPVPSDPLRAQWTKLLHELWACDIRTSQVLSQGLGLELEDPKTPQDWGIDFMPIDTLPLFSTGGNCHRFAILTDFGAQTDLEHAPIVFDSHTSQVPLQVIAHGPEELLGLLAACKHVEVVESVLSDGMSLEEAQEEWTFESGGDGDVNSTAAVDSLTAHWDIPWVADPIRHAQLAANRRRPQICLDEGHGIGVLASAQSTAHPKMYDEDDKDAGHFADFLAGAQHDEVLGAVRMAQAHWILGPQDDGELAAPLGEALRRLGYEDEGWRWSQACLGD